MSARKDFEEWFFDGAASRASERNGDGAYKYMPAAQAWAAWQASAENEREACAKLAENWRSGYGMSCTHTTEAAAAIRKRSNAV